MTGRYAEKTPVAASQSRAEIEATLERFGATAFAYASEAHAATIMFEVSGLRVMFRLPMPDRNAREFTLTPTGRGRSPDSRREVYEQATRQRWRALAVAIKAKLAAVEAGITTVEDEFLSHVMLPDGGTVGHHAKPAIAVAYATGQLPQLLPGVGR
jgi:hypothetical protein